MRLYFLWLFCVTGLSAESQVFHGPTNLLDQTFEDITIYGNANLTNTTVTKLATLKGKADLKNSKIANLYIQGIAKLDNVDVKELFCNGMLFVLNSIVEEVAVENDELNLSHTKVTKIVVRNVKPSTIYLEKGSEVQSIRFVGTKGVVVLADSSSVDHVEGGVINYN